jgi:DNA-binding NarL/FixJ family response regulator
MRTRPGFFWTDEDEAKLRALAADGVHLRTIALRLRRSESNVKTYARKLGITIKQRQRHRFRIDEVVKVSA